MITEQLSNILKLFLPSWNFFDDFSAVPRLDIRILCHDRECDWQPLYTDDSTDNLRRVLFDAQGNLELLEKTFIERAAGTLDASDLQSAKQFEHSAHFETLTGIARNRLPALKPDDEFQFRLVLTTPGLPEEALFVSGRQPVQKETR